LVINSFFLQLIISSTSVLSLPMDKLIASVGIAVATRVVAAGVAGLNAEGGWVDSKASEVIANLVTRAVLFFR
jgi:hypothetical protein